MGQLGQRWDRFAGWLGANADELLVGAIAASVLVAAMLVLRQVGERLCAGDPEYRSWRSVIGRVLAKTSVLFMIVGAVEVVLAYAELPARIGQSWDVLFIIVFAIQGAVWARELVLGVISRRVGEEPGETTLGNAMSIIRVLVSVAVFAIAIIVILDNLGVNVTALVAGLGIGGIAIGLAAQGIFSDLFAALAILFDKPFKKGDTIRYDQSTGTVERIGLKTTRLRALTGEQLVMANTKLLEREIHNLAEARARRMTVHFAVKAERPREALGTIPRFAAEAVAGEKGCKLVRCALTGVGSGAITHELVYDDSAKDNNRIALNRSAVLRGLVERLDTEGLELVRASDLPAPPAPF
ncbi:MAG TPA: mechanosensitive ion channel domain-containing protein [Sphingomicrobium sp.]|nr:mechanosensitive ion channel domain-containing protein [Sphingomicrobium sp.]